MKKLIGVIAETLGISVEQLEGYISEGDLTTEGVTGLTKAGKDKLKEVHKTGFDSGHGKNQKEVLDARDKSLAEKFKFTVGMTAEEMIQKAAENEREAIKNNPQDVEKSPIFTKAMADKEAEIQRLNNLVTETNQKAQSKIVDNTILTLLPDTLKSLGYTVPEDLGRRERFLGMILADMKSTGHQYREDNRKISILDKEGKPLVKDNFNAVTLEDIVGEYAPNIFDKAGTQTPGKSTPGNKTTDPNGGGGGKHNFTKPTNDAEMMKVYNSLETIEEKQAYSEFVNPPEAGTE